MAKKAAYLLLLPFLSKSYALVEPELIERAVKYRKRNFAEYNRGCRYLMLQVDVTPGGWNLGTKCSK